MRKGKRVEVYLPDGHPILLIPKGKRSQTVRESLDLAFWLKEQLKTITTRLEKINNRLEHMEGLVVSGNIGVKEHIPDEEQKKADFDIEAFTEI